MKFTSCECAQAGWCTRHQCLKPEPLFRLCRRLQPLFDAWERGTGPCLDVAPNGELGSDEGPGVLRRAWNFTSAAARHALSGMQTLDEATFERRLAICRECPACDVAQLVCRDMRCGCYLNVKARWHSESCPRDLWPNVETEASA